MADNAKIASSVIKNVGGKENITNAWHCITRLRFNLVNKDKAAIDIIKKIPGVMGAQFSGDQFQVIIGNTVDDVFDEVEQQLGGTGSGAGVAESGKKESIVSRLMDVISGIFTPIIPALAGTGLIKGILALVLAMGWMTANGSWYRVLYMISDAVFYFLPFFIAVTAAKKFRTSEFLGLTIAGVLLYPTMVSAAAAATKTAPIKLFGLINVPFVSYTSSVIPIILAVWLLSYVFRWVKSWMPSAITMMFSPMVALVIVVPITLTVLGPLGNYIGTGLSGVFSWLFAHVGILGGLILGATLPLMIMTGMHYAFLPVVMGNFQTLGYDFMLLPINFVTNMAQAGSAFAVALRTKNKTLRQLGISSGISALLGITEPAMYGINIKKKKPFYAALVAGGIAGAVVTFFGVKGFAMPGLTGLTALPVFISKSAPMNLVWLVVGIALSFILAFVFTLVLGFEDDEEVEEKIPAKTTTINAGNHTSVAILAPIKGDVEPLDKVNDPTFATGIMGKGMAIIPSEGHVVAPVSGKITVLPDSKHAVGITADDGTELLVHIGIDTVELAGKQFTANVKVGDHVEVGDALIDFNLDAIKKAGYDPTVMVIVTNSSDFADVLPMNKSGVIFASEQLLMGVR